MNREPRYQRRLISATRIGAQRRLGDRWTQAWGLIPAALTAVISYVGTGDLVLAAIGGAIGWGFVVMVASVVMAPADEDQRIRVLRDQAAAERDRTLAALDRRKATAGGLDAFALRIAEGTDIARSLRRWPQPSVPPSERNAVRQEQKAGFTREVREWNGRCRETVGIYLPHRVPDLDRPVPPGRELGSVHPGGGLHHEVVVKIEWMREMRAALEVQSINAAILSHDQT